MLVGCCWPIIYTEKYKTFLEGVSQRHLSLFAAMSLVVSSMIGTGVFTSLGYQLNDIQSGFSILMLWLTGGVISLFGALCYSCLLYTSPSPRDS